MRFQSFIITAVVIAIIIIIMCPVGRLWQPCSLQISIFDIFHQLLATFCCAIMLECPWFFFYWSSPASSPIFFSCWCFQAFLFLIYVQWIMTCFIMDLIRFMSTSAFRRHFLFVILTAHDILNTLLMKHIPVAYSDLSIGLLILHDVLP